MKLGIAAVLLLTLAPARARAGSSDLESPTPKGRLLDSVQEVLSTREDLQRVFSQLEFESYGHSAFLWPDSPSPLRGTRVGPFRLLAKPAGAAGAANLRVVIQTTKEFRNAGGAILPDADGATSVRQSVQSVSVLPLEPPDPALVDVWKLVSSKGPAGRLLSSAHWAFFSNRKFESNYTNENDQPKSMDGYFLNEQGELTLGQTDSGTFQLYEYQVMGEHLVVSSHTDEELLLEWTFERE